MIWVSEWVIHCNIFWSFICSFFLHSSKGFLSPMNPFLLVQFFFYFSFFPCLSLFILVAFIPFLFSPNYGLDNGYYILQNKTILVSLQPPSFLILLKARSSSVPLDLQAELRGALFFFKFWNNRIKFCWDTSIEIIKFKEKRYFCLSEL